jgi:hypothetical protein
VTGTSGFAIVDDPPVSLTTLRIPPEPAVLRKIVSRSLRLPGMSGYSGGRRQAFYRMQRAVDLILVEGDVFELAGEVVVVGAHVEVTMA